ncbi:MAG: acyl-CoA thioesterase II [Bacteroidota bacterium]
MESIKELLELLDLERIDENLFRGQNFKTPWGRVFGGQVLAQAIHAAYETVPKDRFLHSLHCYFILAGDPDLPIIYDVERIRDGGSFTTRRIVAIQKGRPIFNSSASFQLKQDGFSHQIDMPVVPGPGTLLSSDEKKARFKQTDPKLFKRIYHPRPIEFRDVEELDYKNPINRPPFRHVWFKSKGDMPDELRWHQEVLAYASDYNLLSTASFPHSAEMARGRTFYASLDHAMWFHRDFRMDDWLLYAMDSPSASSSRGFGRGNVFDQSGRLVSSVVQEGLMRFKPA